MGPGFLFALLLAGAASDPEQLRPTAVLRPPDGPTIVVVEARGSSAAAIRVTVPFIESDSDAGAGHLIQLLAMRRTRRLQQRVGAAVDASRTSRGLVYQVSGAVADFDHLAGVVRELLAPPESSGFVAARTRLEQLNREERETPRGVLRLQLRSRMASSAPSPIGTPASLESMTHARLVELWDASHRRRQLSLVVVGDLPPEVALSSFADLGMAGWAPQNSPSPGPGPGRSTPPRPERIRAWYGEAYPAGDARDPRSAMLMNIASEHLAGVESEFEFHLERWELEGRSWLVLTGAAFSRSARAMRARIRGYRGDVQATLNPTVVRYAKAAVRSALLLQARSPGGLAEVIGQHMDATGDANAASDYLEELEYVDLEAMAAFMDETASAAVTAELGG